MRRLSRSSKKDRVKWHKELETNIPYMIAAWPGIGDLALIVTRYLKDKLGAEEVGEIEPFDFFTPSGVMVRNNIVEEPQFPENKFYYWRKPGSTKRILLFIGEEQPSLKGYELAHCILDVGKKLGMKRVYTCAAALTRIHHTEDPQVWGVGNEVKLLSDLKKYDVVLRGDLQIAGLNGLLLGAAKERGIEGICLLGEVPLYATRIPNPKASLAVLTVLTKMLGIDIDMTELSEVAKEADEEMKKLAAEAMGEFIGRFTQPIWEQKDEE